MFVPLLPFQIFLPGIQEEIVPVKAAHPGDTSPSSTVTLQKDPKQDEASKQISGQGVAEGQKHEHGLGEKEALGPGGEAPRKGDGQVKEGGAGHGVVKADEAGKGAGDGQGAEKGGGVVSERPRQYLLHPVGGQLRYVRHSRREKRREDVPSQAAQLQLHLVCLTLSDVSSCALHMEGWVGEFRPLFYAWMYSCSLCAPGHRTLCVVAVTGSCCRVRGVSLCVPIALRLVPVFLSSIAREVIVRQ